jgi:hypothetical protein
MNHVAATKTDEPKVETPQSLVAADQLEAFNRWVNEPIPEILQTAFAAFEHDLPDLLRDHCREWVAYHGSRRIGISPDSAALYALCEAEGLNPMDVMVTAIYPCHDMEVAY